MTMIEDRTAYEAEVIAFADTPLGDNWDRRSLITETMEIANDPWVLPFVGEVHVSEASARLTSCVAYARGQTIRFAPTSTHRSTPVHELAHVVHTRCRAGGTSHGAEWRTLFVELTAVVYGDRYGDLLRHAFLSHGLSLTSAVLPRPQHPIIDIDRLADASREVRWL